MRVGDKLPSSREEVCALAAAFCTGVVKVEAAFQQRTNAWVDEDETNDFYSLTESPNEIAQGGNPSAGAAPEVQFSQRRLSAARDFSVLLPRNQLKLSPSLRRLEVCTQEPTDKEEKTRKDILKKAGFNENMECILTREMRAGSREAGALASVDTPGGQAEPPVRSLLKMNIPTKFQPPHGKPGFENGNKYCEIVDCPLMRGQIS